MASIKLYLDTRRPRKDGACPLKLSVSHKGSFQISIGVNLLPEQWKNNRVVMPDNLSKQKSLDRYIENRLSSANNILYDLRTLGRLASMTDRELRRALDANSTIIPEATPALFKNHFERFAGRKSNPRVRELYGITRKKISEVSDWDTLQFVNMNLAWLREFEAHLAKTCKVNSRAIHLRNIRAIFNDAIDEEVIDQNTYPFRKFKIKKEATAKRSLSVDDLRTIRDYPCEPHMEKYRDMFMLIFYLIGINTVDLFQLREIRDGRIEYRRSKTGRL